MLDYGFYNMDCMDGMREFPDKFFDLAIVDPVYGDVTHGGYMAQKGGERWGNGKAAEREYNNNIWKQEKTGKEYFDELFRVSKNVIIWGGNYFIEEIGRNSQGWIIWDKQKAEGVRFADAELAYTSFNRATRIFRYKWNGFIQEDMKEKEYRIHPTQKPMRLYEWILMNYAEPNDVILDTHVGSASSLIACRRTGHDYVGFEIDKDYYDLASKRLETEGAQMTIFNYGFNPYQD